MVFYNQLISHLYMKVYVLGGCKCVLLFIYLLWVQFVKTFWVEMHSFRFPTLSVIRRKADVAQR